MFCLGGSVFAMWYFLSLYLQQVLGYSPIEAGLAFLPMPLTIAACTQAATKLTGRLGAGPVLAGGMALIAVGMLLFTRLGSDGSYLSDVLFPSVLCAAGIGFSFVPVTIAATAGVARTEAGLASGLVNTSRQMGGSLGLALLATVATPADRRSGRRRPARGGAHRGLPPRVRARRRRGADRRGGERAGAQPRPCGAAKSSAGPIGMIRLGSSESCVV